MENIPDSPKHPGDVPSKIPKLVIREPTHTTGLAETNLGKLNRFHNAYICNKCNSYFPSRVKLKNHMMRKSSCGVISDSDLAAEIFQEYGECIESWGKIPKTSENKKQLKSLFTRIASKLNAVIRHNNSIPDEVLASAQKEISEMEKVLHDIV